MIPNLSTGLPGDFNHNHTVDAADDTVWRNGLWPTYSPADYAEWKRYYGASLLTGAAGSQSPLDNSSSTIPEPATLTLFALALFALNLRRHR